MNSKNSRLINSLRKLLLGNNIQIEMEQPGQTDIHPLPGQMGRMAQQRPDGRVFPREVLAVLFHVSPSIR